MSIVNKSAQESVILYGRSCRLEPLNLQKHADDLYAAYTDARLFENVNQFSESMALLINGEDLNFVIIDLRTSKAVGQFALKRADALNGVVKLRSLVSSPLPLLCRLQNLKRTNRQKDSLRKMSHSTCGM